MLGVFSYTVILTYISLISAISGITLGFDGNAIIPVICILICGLCDMFDGKIANTKKRDEFEIKFGKQIDSLTDLVAFGILPIIIGGSLNIGDWYYIPIYSLYVLCVLIHLANYNSTNDNKIVGLPVTISALIFPILYLFRRLSSFNFIYAITLLLLSILYILKIKINKPNKKLLIGLLIAGLLEFILVVIF